MKRLYTILLSAAVAVSSMAQVTVSKTGRPSNVKAPSVSAIEAKPVSEGLKHKASPVSKAIDYSTLQWRTLGSGVFSDGIMPSFYSNFSSDPKDVTIEVCTTNESIYRVVTPFDGGANELNYLIIDATDPDFVLVPDPLTPVNDNVDGVTYVASASYVASSMYGYSKEEFLEELSDVNIYVRDNVIYFPGQSVFFNWPEAPEDSEYDTDPTAWTPGKAVEGYLALPGGVVESPWEYLGESTFSDGLVGPMFSVTPSPIQVKVYRKKSNPNYYKVEKAFSGVVAAASAFEIDATNPDLVVVPMQSTGINATERGMTYILGCRALCASDADFMEKYPQYNITLSDNVITFPEKSVLLAWPNWPGNENQAFFNNFSVETTLEIPVPTQSYTVGISTAEDAGGSIRLFDGETEVVSGTAVEAGTELTVIATPAEGYGLKAIYVNGTALPEGETTFVVESETTVSAEFEALSNEPTYSTPGGAMHPQGNNYLVQLYSEGATVNVDQSWDSTPSALHQIVEGAVEVAPEATFTLNLKAKKLGPQSSTTVYEDLRFARARIYTDWDADGVFTEDQVIGTESPQAPYNVIGNMDVLDITKQFTVPAEAENTNSRIRVIYHNAWSNKDCTANSTDLVDGMAYDVKVKVGQRSGIDSITGDATDAPAEFYNLQGIRMDGNSLTPGIYIMRQGSKATKVLVR